MNGSGRKSPRAGGALLAASLLIGVATGAVFGEPSIGFLAGLAAGLALLGGVWWLDRR